MGVIVICSGGRPELNSDSKAIIARFIEEQQKKEEDEIVKIKAIGNSIIEFKDECLIELDREKPYMMGKKGKYINNSKHNKFYKR